MIKVNGFDKVLSVYSISKEVLGKNLVAIEYMDGFAFNIVV